MAENRKTTERNGNGGRRWRTIIVIAIVVIALAAFISSRKGEVAVRTDRAVRENLSTSISTNGKVEPIDNFEAHAPAPTTVNKIYVREGQQVRAGTLLMQLEDADFRAQAARSAAAVKAAEADQSAVKSGGTQEEVLNTQAELQKARADRDAAQRNLDALQRLQKTGAAAPAEVRDAATRLANADAQVKLLEQKQQGRYSRPEISRVNAQAEQARASYQAAMDALRHTEIRAPFDGTVYSIPIRQGEYAGQGEMLLQLANLSRVQVRAFVDEPELGKLKVGQAVQITWDALPGKSWHGEVSQMPYTVTTVGTRNVGQVLCGVDNNDGQLLPNINVTVQISQASKSDVVTVAREGVHDDEKGRFVYVVKDGHLQRQSVTTGISSSTRVEVDSGLQPGETVALNALNSEPLHPGMSVRISK